MALFRGSRRSVRVIAGPAMGRPAGRLVREQRARSGSRVGNGAFAKPPVTRFAPQRLESASHEGWYLTSLLAPTTARG